MIKLAFKAFILIALEGKIQICRLHSKWPGISPAEMNLSEIKSQDSAIEFPPMNCIFHRYTSLFCNVSQQHSSVEY